MSDDKPKLVGPFPTEDNGSFGYHAVRTGVDIAASLVPGSGYVLGKLVKHYIGEPLEDRREEWFISLGEGVLELQSRLDGFDPNSLRSNEEFISTVYEATHLAMKTHREEKRTALKNMVLNVAAGYPVEEVLRGTFFSLIDRYSALHIEIFKTLSDPNNFRCFLDEVKKNPVDRRSILLHRLFALDNTPLESFDRVVEDLENDKLTDGTLRGQTQADDLMINCLTQLGDLFFKFISSPVS